MDSVDRKESQCNKSRDGGVVAKTKTTQCWGILVDRKAGSVKSLIRARREKKPWLVWRSEDPVLETSPNEKDNRTNYKLDL